MISLYLRDEDAGTRWCVWPSAGPCPPGAVQENRSYRFELVDADDAAAADLLIDEQPLEALRSRDPRTAHWRWTPGFHAGCVEVELRTTEGSRRFEIVTDADVEKLTRAAFDTMVGEILEDTFSLFSLGAFRKGVARGTGTRPPAIARLEYLRSKIPELERVTRRIAKSPRRLLRAEDTLVPYHRAGRVTGPEVLRSLRGRTARAPQSATRLPGGLVPLVFHKRVHRDSLDIPEHRQMAAVLRVWVSWLTAAAEQLLRAARSRQPSEAAERSDRVLWARRCRRLSHRLQQMLGEAMFAEAAVAPPGLVLSPLFRNEPNYRRFFQIAKDIDRGIAAVFGDFLNLPLARTFDLYELWCYLRLLRAAVAEHGESGVDAAELFVSDRGGGITLQAYEASVRIPGGWRLCFQREYQEFWLEAEGAGSMSRPMRPDIVLQRSAPGDAPSAHDKIIVLDAKYRIRNALNDAISSIHMYRDALVHEGNGTLAGMVSAAYLLTPDMPILGKGGYREHSMPARLFHPEYRGAFRFGAMSLRPGMSMTEIRAALRSLEADAGGGPATTPSEGNSAP